MHTYRAYEVTDLIWWIEKQTDKQMDALKYRSSRKVMKIWYLNVHLLFIDMPICWDVGWRRKGMEWDVLISSVDLCILWCIGTLTWERERERDLRLIVKVDADW